MRPSITQTFELRQCRSAGPTPHVVSAPGKFRNSFSIGGVSLELSGDSVADSDGGADLADFQSRHSESDITVTVRWHDDLVSHDSKEAFDSGATWRLFHSESELVFDFSSPLLGSRPYKRMKVDSGFSHAEVTLSRTALEGSAAVSAVEYPVCELLITNYLAHRGLGVEVHGCGLIDEATGAHLFLGHSGAGKSTTARLWESLRRPQILSDDRIILRLHDGELWMYGTPWHGEAAFALAHRAKLNRIHILQHGTENKFSPLGLGRAVAEVFARSFPPFHSPEGLERTIEFLKRALDRVPCYEFQFVPNESCVNSVLGSMTR